VIFGIHHWTHTASHWYLVQHCAKQINKICIFLCNAKMENKLFNYVQWTVYIHKIYECLGTHSQKCIFYIILPITIEVVCFKISPYCCVISFCVGELIVLVVTTWFITYNLVGILLYTSTYYWYQYRQLHVCSDGIFCLSHTSWIEYYIRFM